MPSLPTRLTPANAAFVLISFEGPDRYSQAGGLGVRVTGLAQTLVERGFETHLFFVGDPALPGYQSEDGGRIVLHRWCQWLSGHHPGGVYDGEEQKRLDLNASLPGYLADRLIPALLASGRIPVVLSEEWQTAECACLLSDLLHARGLRDRALLFWNANNPYSFDRIDWARLGFTNTLTTVSRYMRNIMRARGVDPLVIPNGIPRRLVQPVDPRRVAGLRARLGEGPVFFKMARWAPEKGWDQALDAIMAMNDEGRRATLIARGGGTAGPAGGIVAAAVGRGLRVSEVRDPGGLDAQLSAIGGARADVVSLGFSVTEPLARVLYATADGVLANSVSEPFGLVGLEAMAASGLVYTGGTGEDYAVGDRNAVVLETLDPREIMAWADEFAAQPERSLRMRRDARGTARRFIWEAVAGRLVALVERQARRRGLLARETAVPGPEPVRDEVMQPTMSGEP